jgi:peptidoglycan/xylan/chitin deacetylase (PgdA/CDA1 family)
VLHALVATALALAPATARAEPVPILVYHVLSAPPTGARFPELYVPPARFRAEMRWLARHRYHPVTLLHAYEHWKADRPLPRRPIVLSFDDGYLSQYTVGFRTLRARRWPGVLNLQVDFLRPAGGMRPWRVRRLIAAGWEIDAHTFTHPDLTGVDNRGLRHEVGGSRLAIRRRFHVAADFFCYPAGRYDARVVRAVRRAGFLGATTEAYGLARPPGYYTLDRIPVTGGESVATFAAEIQRLRP